MQLPRQRLLAALLVFLACGQAIAADATSQPGAKPTRVLFIGNSYTAYNGGLPKILKQMADSAGVPFEAKASLHGGKSLEFHYNETKGRELIAQGGWDYVVLQDFSTQATSKPALLAEYAAKFDADIKKVGAKTVFYMTWARQHRPENQAIITAAYEKSAKELGAKIAPAGLAWQRVLTERPDIPLHFEDKSHPNPAGTYLTACVFYQVLFGAQPPEKVPPIKNQRTDAMDELPLDVAAYLRKVAAETVAR